MTNNNTRELLAICDGCGKPVEPESGYVHVSYAKIHEHEQAKREWEKANPPGTLVSVGTLMELPDPARWHCHHRGCDPKPDSSDYWIDVKDVSTWQGLTRCTAHLAQKNWFMATDWINLLEGVVYNGQRRIVQVA